MFLRSTHIWSAVDRGYDEQISEGSDDVSHLDVYFFLSDILDTPMSDFIFNSTTEFSNEPPQHKNS